MEEAAQHSGKPSAGPTTPSPLTPKQQLSVSLCPEGSMDTGLEGGETGATENS